MKPKGCKTSHRHLRDLDLAAAFDFAMKHPRVSSARQAYILVAEMRAPQFYISAKRAAVIVSAILDGTAGQNASTMRNGMFGDIAERVAFLQHKCRPGTPVLRLVERVLRQPAPSFYLSPRSIAMMLSRIQKQNRCKATHPTN